MIAEKIYIKAKSVEEAVAEALANDGNFCFLAGGTDVLVNKFQGTEEATCLIDITGIEELKKVVTDGNFLKIGSLIKLDDLNKHEAIAKNFPALLDAAHQAATPMLRKTATIGGNILCENRCSFFNQSEFWREAVGYCLKCEGEVCIATGGTKACFSKFVSDTAPVLISMDTQLEIADEKGTQMIALSSIYTGDGINPRSLPKTAIIKNIILPLDKNFKTAFRKLRPREAVDFTSLTTAVTIDNSGSLKIVLGGVDPKPVVVIGSVNDDKDKLIKEVVKKSRIVDNDYYSRSYRKEMIPVFLKHSFKELSI